MFSDFKNFTNLAEKLPPEKLVSEIHFYFSMYDQIINKYNIEKIKTIGDSYMCAGGIPNENSTNATDVILAAFEIQRFMQAKKKEKEKDGEIYFETRIGIHTGPVVAGIVGTKKFAYDIWGDTVNVARRMEACGEIGKVNISGGTFELIKEQFNCVYRGKVEAKNKGKIDMYFVEDPTENEFFD
jgi:class 3 adenylate cyclase